jgi:hypothetical protein
MSLNDKKKFDLLEYNRFLYLFTTLIIIKIIIIITNIIKTEAETFYLLFFEYKNVIVFERCYFFLPNMTTFVICICILFI